MAGMATSRPMTVAINAPATPGAIAVSVAAFALATPENVSMTPQTVPSSPINGPPATAVERMIIPLSNPMPSGRTIERLLLAMQIQRIAGGSIGREKLLRPFARAPKLPRFADDDGPTQHGDDGQAADGDLAFGGCFLERELNRAQCEHGL